MMIKGVDCPIKSGNDGKGKLQPAGRVPPCGED